MFTEVETTERQRDKLYRKRMFCYKHHYYSECRKSRMLNHYSDTMCSQYAPIGTDRKLDPVFRSIKGAQAWEFFARVFCTKWTHLGMWLRDWGKNWIFFQLTPDFDCFWFFAAYWECGKQKKKFEASPKLKVGGGCLWAHKHAYNVFFGKFWSLSSFMNVKKV